jgi:hypothetical protein
MNPTTPPPADPGNDTPQAPAAPPSPVTERQPDPPADDDGEGFIIGVSRIGETEF